MNQDDILDLIFNQGSSYQNKRESKEIMAKLDEIERLLQYLIKNNRNFNERRDNLCEQVLTSSYAITEGYSSLYKNYFYIKLDENRLLVTFKDTIDLLNMYFSSIKDEEIESKIPKRLVPLFRFMKRNGLIYFDHESRTYKIIDYK
jgi:hypothetical protein